MFISKNPRKRALTNVNRQLRYELLGRPTYVTARVHMHVFRADLRLFSRMAIPSPKKLHVQLLKATHHASQYERWVAQDAVKLATIMPNLEILRIGILPNRQSAIDDALTIAAMDTLSQEIVNAHPILTSFTHVVKNDTISYTITK